MGESMLVTLEEAKLYLRLDNDSEDALIANLINTAQLLCEDIIRKKVDTLEKIPETLKIGVLYGVTYLYENREQADYNGLIKTLAGLLFGVRDEVF
ncbi:head-tail connector protein [Ruminiclostridium papyrosolvens]|uniref:Phage gp6-like head-tail connector protein n=1 Tax=Ruminiclostridium papyrosolvens C7 TaxID=1330534 RepID=U4QYG8_9FIRM|nr:head-tail connector protein [Ruminiclostridium papyrosolvens]EPR08114.1 hypothetical protein L323_18470 [Ruminiclostridium papyrosolvens C7]